MIADWNGDPIYMDKITNANKEKKSSKESNNTTDTDWDKAIDDFIQEALRWVDCMGEPKKKEKKKPQVEAASCVEQLCPNVQRRGLLKSVVRRGKAQLSMKHRRRQHQNSSPKRRKDESPRNGLRPKLCLNRARPANQWRRSPRRRAGSRSRGSDRRQSSLA